MDKQIFETFTKILNTLMLVETKGESTVILGSCITAMKDTLQQVAFQQKMAEAAKTAAAQENAEEE